MVNPIDQKESVAFLLGAVFSIPMGYPTGSAVNKGILNFDELLVSFSPAGILASNNNGTKPEFGYTNSHEREFCLCKELIAAYSKIVAEFDYEQFMDVLRSKSVCSECASIFDKYIDDSNTSYGLAGNLPDIYSQMVAHLLKDADNISWYDGMPMRIGQYTDGVRPFAQFLVT